MPWVNKLYETAKKRNFLAGIIIFILISFVSYLLSAGVSILFYGDIQFIVGALFGIYFSLKYQKSKYSPILYGLIVGVLGGIFAALSIVFFEWMYYSISNGFQLGSLIFLFSNFSIIGLIIGAIIGLIFGYFFVRKRTKSKLTSKDEKLFEDLELE